MICRFIVVRQWWIKSTIASSQWIDKKWEEYIHAFLAHKKEQTRRSKSFAYYAGHSVDDSTFYPFRNVSFFMHFLNISNEICGCTRSWTLAFPKCLEIHIGLQVSLCTVTVYRKKYAHGFVVLCCVVVKQSFIMNSHEVFIHIHQGCFAGTIAPVPVK